MEIDFAFLKNSPTFKSEYSAANQLANLYNIQDYRDVIGNARRLLESLTDKIFKLEKLNKYYKLPSGQQHNLRNDTHYLRSQLDYPVSIMNLFDEVRRMGNAAIHDSKITPDKKQAWRSICDIHDILVFLINNYDLQKLYYLRPDLAMEAQNFPVRENKKAAHKLEDHHISQYPHSQNKRKKARTVRFSSSPVKASGDSNCPNPRITWWTKIKRFFTSVKHK